MLVAGFFILGFVKTLPFLLFALTLVFAGSGLLRPCITSLITQEVPKGQQGFALGLTQSLMSISQIIAPVIGGILIQKHFLNFWAWIPAATSATGLWSAYHYHIQGKKGGSHDSVETRERKRAF